MAVKPVSPVVGDEGVTMVTAAGLVLRADHVPEPVAPITTELLRQMAWSGPAEGEQFKTVSLITLLVATVGDAQGALLVITTHILSLFDAIALTKNCEFVPMVVPFLYH